MNDSSLAGLMVLPGNIGQVGEDAFSRTNLFALEIPEKTISVGNQALNHAAYVLVSGKETSLSGLSGVKFLIAPEDSRADIYADSNSLDFVPLEQLVENDGFYYQRTAGGLKLLSAKDATKVSDTVSIPNRIGNEPVTGLSAYAFYGCTMLETVHLPETLENDANLPTALEDCPGSGIVFDPVGLTVRSVSANVTSGSVGDRITWTVDASSDQQIRTYSYTLKKNGQTVDTLQSNSSSYTQTVMTAGAYMLEVEVTDAAGRKDSGTSPILYIAVESMVMTVPETLNNGEDLTVQVEEVSDALRYSVYLTNEATGELIGSRNLTKPGKITFSGYQLDEGMWRVTGYVYGNNFRYSVPTVRTVAISGAKAPGPVIPQQEPVIYWGRDDERFVRLRLSETEPFAVRFRYRYSDGTLSSQYEYSSSGEYLEIYPEGDYEQWQQGGAILLCGAVKQDGAWSDWGEVTEVEILSAPKLDTPVLTVQEAIQAGRDLTVAFTDVEHGDRYFLRILEGYDPDWSEWNNEGGSSVYSREFSRGSTVVVPGYSLEAGVYTVQVRTWSDENYYQSDWACRRLEITGERPAAPQVTADKTEQCLGNDPLTLSIYAPGAEGAYIFCESWRNGRRYTGWSPWTVSLDEEGRGEFRQDWYFDDESEWIGQVFHYRAAAIMADGVWSELSEDTLVLIKESNPLPSPETAAPESLRAGEDLTFRFSPVEEAEYYSASLERTYGDETIYSWGSEKCKPGQDLTAPGYLLTQGSYRLTVRAYSETRGNSTSEKIISVTGTRPAAPDITGNPEEVRIRDTVIFMIDTAEADQFAVDYKGTSTSGHEWWSDRKTVGTTGDTSSWSYTFDDDAKDAEFTFRFAAKRDNVWSAWRTVTMTVLDLPLLEPAAIHTQETWDAGEDFTVTYDPVEHADYYRWTLYKEDDRMDSGSEDEPVSHLFDGYNYEPGTYRFRVTAYSDSYRVNPSEFVFTIAGNKPNAPAVSVDKTEVTASETYTFTISTINTEDLRCRIWYYNNGEEYIYSSARAINVLEDSTNWSTSNSDGGIRSYSFAIRVNNRWTAWSEKLTVTSSIPEPLPVPSLDLPSALTAGRNLTVSVSAAENMDYYEVCLYNGYGSRIAYKSIAGGTGGTATFEGFRLTAGVYTVKAYATRGNTSSVAQGAVTVTSGDRPEAPAVTPDTETGRVNVYYGFTLDTAGAEKAAVRYYQDGYSNNVDYRTFDCTNDTTRWQDQNSISGQVWKYAFAVQKDGVWSPWSSTSTVTITDREILAQPVIDVPDTIEAGRDVYLSFSGVEHADSYSLRLTYPDGSTNSWTAYPGVRRRLIGYDLNPGTYIVSVTASGAEYESNTAVRPFTVTGTRADAPDVVVSADEVFTNETFTFSIGSAGAQEIAYRYKYGNNTYYSSSGTLNVLSDRTIWDTYVSSAGTYRFTFCVLRDGCWSAWSPVTEMVVKTRPQLPEPDVEAPEMLLRGRDLTVTVGEVEGATEYDVYLYNNLDQRIISLWHSVPGEFVVSGYRLPIGSLRIRVSVYGPDGGSTTVSRNLAVTDAQLPESPQVTPPEQTTVSRQTYFYFTVQTEGATKAAVRYYRIGSPNDLSISEFSASTGESETSWRGYQYSGGNTYAYSFAVQKDGVWSEWSSFTEITIE